MDKKIFSSRSPLKFNLLVAVTLSIALIIFDLLFPAPFNALQKWTELSFEPLFVTASYSEKLNENLHTHMQSKSELILEVKNLQAKLLISETLTHQLAQLRAENTEYREWLNLPALKESHLQIAQIIGHNIDLSRDIVVINRGSKHGVTVKDFATDAKGVMGQVVEVFPFTSRLMLLSDKRHSVSVKNQRTGMLAILSGTGDSTRLSLDYIPTTADIQLGDTLVTSGMGGRFNAGYPIGTVIAIKKHGKSEFAEIAVKPIATLQGGNLVAIVPYIPPVILPPVANALAATPAPNTSLLPPQPNTIIHANQQNNTLPTPLTGSSTVSTQPHSD